MSVTVRQSRALRQIARVVYDFLPGSGYHKWKGHISFASTAQDLGLAGYWQAGSKEPAIASLLELTLGKRPERFEPLVLAIVKNGLTYRHRNGNPIRREEIEEINGLLLEVGFNFPDLWAEDFLNSLDGDPLSRARDLAQQAQRADASAAIESAKARATAGLRDRFYALEAQVDRQAAGLALESLLTELFGIFDLDPRHSFRVTGEQLDGSFVMDSETYLLEAKWYRHGVSEDELLVFRGKVEGKSPFTRGVFVSIHGFTAHAVEAITTGKQPNFFLFDGYDLTTVLEGGLQLPDLLRFKWRKLTEEGRVFASAKELLQLIETGK